ncbi:RNA-binding cell elongation regulator Jag/EloR [Paludicola sp. MB14-C6]|uniref:RNA-binding cell elongation regulator Jag/EloR n=1 Tax=Paludihabitans sp. MB14-C6 TaxID=3070656 RepID=UPI0027DDEAF5|nr:RNA-binding cell elongation regulator Jag/EloR [Paludicola sp. MB14-C6]WMJ21783.1 RNA-binding cell elongation regulator Jag/EloR [Paludicola sp. MB14-C6]
MIQEVIAKAASVEEAILKAVEDLGVDRENCQIEVIETPKKSLFGKLKGEAIVKAWVEVVEKAPVLTKLDVAKSYLRDILDAMDLAHVEMKIEEKEDGAVVTFEGDGIAALIGHHGETLDSLQYLVALTCNRVDGDYYRITLDCGNYRDKREQALESLANRIAQKVKKTGRSQLLEPMNPYERRIIHSVVSDIDGVFSKSKGEEPNRRVVIMSETPVKFNRNYNRKDDYKKPYVHKPERTMEEILKNDFKDKEKKAELYSKIEL